MQTWDQIVGYMDDSFFPCIDLWSLSTCRKRDIVNLFSKLAFKIGQEKSHFFLKEIEYLEIVINYENMTILLLPKNKAAKSPEFLEVIRTLQRAITKNIEKPIETDWDCLTISEKWSTSSVTLAKWQK